jgi:hypothetical protein
VAGGWGLQPAAGGEEGEPPPGGKEEPPGAAARTCGCCWPRGRGGQQLGWVGRET